MDYCTGLISMNEPVQQIRQRIIFDQCATMLVNRKVITLTCTTNLIPQLLGDKDVFLKQRMCLKGTFSICC